MIRLKTYITSVLAAALLLAGTCGASAQSKNFLLGKWTETHAAILKELSESYVDSLPVDKMERKGIDAMLSELDPYTVFIPAEENEDLQMMIQKAYGGIGAVIYRRGRQRDHQRTLRRLARREIRAQVRR